MTNTTGEEDFLDSILPEDCLDGQMCYDLDSNPKVSLAFKGLLDNLMDYNAIKSINRTGQVTILRK